MAFITSNEQPTPLRNSSFSNHSSTDESILSGRAVRRFRLFAGTALPGNRTDEVSALAGVNTSSFILGLGGSGVSMQMTSNS
jgi:hypothetical protein